MAKGAKKKTKWVTLPLATSTAPSADHHKSASKSYRGTNRSTYVDNSTVNSEKSSNPEHGVSSVERKFSWNTNGNSRRQSAEDSNGQTYSDGYHQTHPPRNYSTHFKSHYSNSSYHHNGSRRPHYNSYSDRSRSNNVNETRSEQNGAVIINEEEYTKITTPRQDVLFKKGYLSRPKKQTTTSLSSVNENGTMTGSSSINGTTDGSDVATGSGTVSTSESVTSDSTYLTDGHLLDYPAPLPYFGYIDQSGVLVMNGFAVDNSGFPYMNGGQTYIYPPNYHCQPSFDEDGQIVNEELAAPSALHENQNQSSDSVNGVSETQTAINGLGPDTPLNSISEETVEGLVNECDSADLMNQQVPQQSMLSPFENSYDYAQFYNSFYYPGCMMAPFPVMANEMYFDQFDASTEEEQARQQSFRKRKKRYRSWDEYPPTFYPDESIDTMYQYPNTLNVPENPISTPPEVPVDGIIAESSNLNDRTVPNLPPIFENIDTPNQNANQLTSELPSSQHRSEQVSSQSRSSNSQTASKVADRGFLPSTVSQEAGKPRSHVQKTRKKDLIEMTRAFAEQNIDLTRPVSLYKAPEAQKGETNEWRTVKHGKEVSVQEEPERNLENTKEKAKEELLPIKHEKLFFEDCKPEQTIGEMGDISKRDKKETATKKGKKTAKTKGKKLKKPGLAIQHAGFEVIEPEFTVISKVSIEKFDHSGTIHEHDETLMLDSSETKDGAVIEREEANSIEVTEQDTKAVEHEKVQNQTVNGDEFDGSGIIVRIGLDEDEKDLENDLRDIQLSDIQTGECDQDGKCHQQEENEAISTENEIPENENNSEEMVAQEIVVSNGLEFVDEGQKQEFVSDSNELKETEKCESTSVNTCEEEMDLIEKKLTLNCNLSMNSIELNSLVQLQGYESGAEGEEQKCKHFINEEYSDSGVQSPAAFTTSSSNSKERKSSSSSIGSDDINLTDAVTRWLSETLSNKRLEEMFVLPEDPLLLHRIHQFNVRSYDDSLVSSDMYSSSYSSDDEADDSVDSDYMSDVQAKKRQINGNGQQKTELKKDQLAKQTANGHHLMNNEGDPSNHKQKRCIIM